MPRQNPQKSTSKTSKNPYEARLNSLNKRLLEISRSHRATLIKYGRVSEGDASSNGLDEKERMKELQKKREQLLKAIDDNDDKLSELTNELEALRQELKDAQTVENDLNEDLKAIKSKISTMEKKNEELKALVSDCAKLNKTLELELSQKNQKLAEKTNNLLRLEKEVGEVENRIETLKQLNQKKKDKHLRNMEDLEARSQQIGEEENLEDLVSASMEKQYKSILKERTNVLEERKKAVLLELTAYYNKKIDAVTHEIAKLVTNDSEIAEYATLCEKLDFLKLKIEGLMERDLELQNALAHETNVFEAEKEHLLSRISQLEREITEKDRSKVKTRSQLICLRDELSVFKDQIEDEEKRLRYSVVKKQKTPREAYPNPPVVFDDFDVERAFSLVNVSDTDVDMEGWYLEVKSSGAQSLITIGMLRRGERIKFYMDMDEMDLLVSEQTDDEVQHHSLWLVELDWLRDKVELKNKENEVITSVSFEVTE